MSLSLDAKALVAIFGVSGTLHLTRPRLYQPLMPDFVPAHREVIYASGVAELACAAGLLHPRTRRLAGYAGAALLVLVFPGKLMRADPAPPSRPPAYKPIAYGGLPRQRPMSGAAWWAPRTTD
jgi:uncharacterized membrane protein